MHYKDTCISTDFINAVIVQKSIQALKEGKAAGLDGPMSEHTCFEHPILLGHLNFLLSMLYKHGVLPDDFGRGVILYSVMQMVTGS